LTFTHHNEKGGFNLVALFYCSWSGGSSCSASGAEDIDYGVPPFLFAGRNERSRYELVPPLLHYFITARSTTRRSTSGPLGVEAPARDRLVQCAAFLWHTWGKNEEHLTLFPFLHYGYEGTRMLLINPLFVSARGEQGESTFATWAMRATEGGRRST